MKLPARVRVTRPPLPLTPALAAAVRKLCPQVPPTDWQAVALAIAGGTVVGAQLRTASGEVQAIEPGWRGRGIEAALQQALQDG